MHIYWLLLYEHISLYILCTPSANKSFCENMHSVTGGLEEEAGTLIFKKNKTETEHENHPKDVLSVAKIK